MPLVGDPSSVAFDIGPYWLDSIQHQHITIFVGNRPINPIDDVVYLPSFYTGLKKEIGRLNTEEYSRPGYRGLPLAEVFERLYNEEDGWSRVLCYDIGTCPAACHFVETDSGGYILYKFWDARHTPKEEIGKVFVAESSKNQLLKTLGAALGNLSTVWV